MVVTNMVNSGVYSVTEKQAWLEIAEAFKSVYQTEVKHGPNYSAKAGMGGKPEHVELNKSVITKNENMGLCGEIKYFVEKNKLPFSLQFNMFHKIPKKHDTKDGRKFLVHTWPCTLEFAPVRVQFCLDRSAELKDGGLNYEVST